MNRSEQNPWWWVGSLYVAEGIPYVMVMVIAEMMYKRLGSSNADAAFYASWFYLPWVVMPLLHAIVCRIKKQRCFVVLLQFVSAVALAGVAYFIVNTDFVKTSLTCFWLLAFCSAVHGETANRLYKTELDNYKQALFASVRRNFFKMSGIAGVGLTLMVAGNLELYYGGVRRAWNETLLVVSVIVFCLALYHLFLIVFAKSAEASRSIGASLPTVSTYVSFFKKKSIWLIVVFALLFHLPEAFLAKVSLLFMIDPIRKGGLGLTLSQIGFCSGTLGVIAFVLGGVFGGVLIKRKGLKTCILPIAFCMALPYMLYIFLARMQPADYSLVCTSVFVQQFFYGLGMTLYVVIMHHLSRGENEMSHYAVCTGLMAFGLMVPGLFAGMLQENVGYVNFFIIVLVCSIATVAVSYLVDAKGKME